jgi:hypothetical protein
MNNTASYNRLATLWVALAKHTKLCQYVSEADIFCFQRRVDGEGLSFLTTVLPRLGKDLEAAFNCGRYVNASRFKCRKGHSYPLFLSGAFSRVLHPDGTLRDDCDAGAVACIRQLTLMFYKLKLGFTPEQEERVSEQFIATDASLPSLGPMRRQINLDPTVHIANSNMLDIARKAVHGLLKGCSPFGIRPRHGSGSSACGVKPHERYGTCRYIPRLDAVYNYGDHFFFNDHHVDHSGLRWWIHREEVEPPARVVFVEKDSRGPRLISMEPRELMFIQQGLMTKLYDHVSKHRAIASQLDFTDQSRNRDGARKASLTHDVSSLDLSEASDRVSWELVEHLFPRDWVTALAATRSLFTVLPDGRMVIFRKFAPMGSALCFPVEAICFWALAHAAVPDGGAFLERTLTDNLSDDDYTLSVFGDDILCESEFTSNTVKNLESVGLKVNLSKSYTQGPFRESCGGDYLNGVDVGFVRVNHLPVAGSTKSEAAFRCVDAINNLIAHYGYGTFGEELTAAVRQWYGSIPTDCNWEIISPDGEVLTANDPRAWLLSELGLAEFVKPHNGLTILAPQTDVPRDISSRWNEDLQRFEFHLYGETPREFSLSGTDWSHLLRSSLLRGADPETGYVVDTSLRYTLPRRMKRKRGWTNLEC